ncbi:hydroxymethylbilane synthase [Paraliomyxa miuraensis]|uniref:hydroxymethylbilane synthase n=1 Tax=Paraliomyxa miuraensis TaxID=376150 RepID=UPI00225B8396|nr:hydroxymethylbilane synthase [Paraliomyxa miuraensis]MCX4245969.1 hydroxymethylbilane synthase [Paraliomyxa miuraensis]
MTDARPVRIGTRGSALALWQARHIRDELMTEHPGLEVELEIITTEGDRVQDRPLHEIGGKGLFVRAIEQRLLDGTVDVAVHSMKDLPAFGPPGLMIACTPPREDPRDALVGPAGATLATLPAGSRVGTGSLRRGALARRINPGVEIVPIRGNVPTRMGKVDAGELDAVLLAAAGLRRLEQAARIVEYLDPDAFCPAPAQGILALQCREDDARIRGLLAALADDDATLASAAERGFVQRLQAGCTVPMGCHATRVGDEVVLYGLVVHPSAAPCFEARRRGPADRAAALGRSLAEELLAAGADRVLAALATTSPG